MNCSKIVPVLSLLLLASSRWDRSCQIGPGVRLRIDSKEGAHCLPQDLDYDGDVDQDDFGIFQRHEPPRPMVVVIVLDQSLLGAIGPEEYVRQALNQRYQERIGR